MLYKQRLLATIFQPVEFLENFKQQPVHIRKILSNDLHLSSWKTFEEKDKMYVTEIYNWNNWPKLNKTIEIDAYI